MNPNANDDRRSQTATNASAFSESHDSFAQSAQTSPAGLNHADESFIPEAFWTGHDQGHEADDQADNDQDAGAWLYSESPNRTLDGEQRTPERAQVSIADLDRLNVENGADAENPALLQQSNGTSAADQANMSQALVTLANESAEEARQANRQPEEHPEEPAVPASQPPPVDGQQELPPDEDDTQMSGAPTRRDVWLEEGRPKCTICKKKHPPPCWHADGAEPSSGPPKAESSKTAAKRQRDDGGQGANGGQEAGATAKKQKKAGRRAGFPKLWCFDCEAEHPWPDRDGSTYHIRTREESAHARNMQRRGLAPAIDPNAFGANAPLRITASTAAAPTTAAPTTAAPRAQQIAPPPNPQNAQAAMQERLSMHDQAGNNRVFLFVQSLQHVNEDNRMAMIGDFLRLNDDPSWPSPDQSVAPVQQPLYSDAAAVPGLAPGQTVLFPPNARPGHVPGQTMPLPQGIRQPPPPRGGQGGGRGRGRGRGRGSGSDGRGGGGTNLQNAGRGQPPASGNNPGQNTAGNAQPPAPTNNQGQHTAGQAQPAAPGNTQGQTPAGQRQPTASGQNQSQAGTGQPSSSANGGNRFNALSPGPSGLSRGDGAERR